MEVAQMEKGHLYKKEQPSFQKGELGKGANVPADKQGTAGSPLPMGADKYATKVKEIWNKALSAATKFKRPK